MTENKNTPAFPVAGITGEGLSKREFVAAFAPSEIPDWFKHTSPKDCPIEPDWQKIENKEDKNECRDWARDGSWNLPDHLKWFQEAMEKYIDDYDAWRTKNQEMRYFQWREYYADTLLSQLSEKPLTQ